MRRRVVGYEPLAVVVAAVSLAVMNSYAAVISTESKAAAYTVAGNDLLQTHRASFDFFIDLYTGGGGGTIPDVLHDGGSGSGAAGNYCVARGTITYNLDTTYHPQGFEVTTVNTYTGWNDLGRVNQKYTVSFRKVGSGVFTDPVSVNYTGTNTQTFVSITGLGLTGVDAIRFTFPDQQNLGVGYKELDVIGPVPVVPYVVTGENNGTGWPVSNSDLLQTGVGSVDDAINPFNEAGYVNQGSPALADGIYGPADAKGYGCGISSGTLTYNLDLAASPAGYSITNIDTYCGWQDAGRDNQNYTVSFRKVGSDSFGYGIAVNHVGTINETHVNIADLGLVGIAALRFSFPGQENGGVGYKEFDVMGADLDYFDVTRLDSGIKVITNSADAVVRVTEGTGSPGDITLEAATNTIRYLCQSADAGAAVIDPEGQALALDGISLPEGAGGLTIGTGELIPLQLPLVLENSSSNALVINSAVVNGRSNASFVEKSGNGTVALNGTNSYSGTTILRGGVLEIGSFSNYGADGGLGNRVKDYARNVGLLFRGGTLRYAGSTPQSTDRAIRINADGGGGRPGSAVIDASGSNPAATLTFTATASPDFFENGGSRSLSLIGSNTGNNRFGMAIRETGGTTTLVKSGAGTWITSGANIYSGGTVIEGGALRSNATGSGPVEIAAGATWDAGVTGQTVAGLSGTGNVVRSWGQISTGANGETLISPEKDYIHLLDFGNGSGATVNGVAFDSIGGTSGTGWSLTGCPNLYNEPSSTNGYTQLVSDFRYNGKPGVLTFSNLTVGQLYNIVIYTKVDHWRGRPQDATFTNGADVQQLINTEPGNYGYYSFRFVANGATASITMTPRTNDTFHWFAASLETEEPLPLTVGDGSDYLFAGVISGPTTLIKQGSGRLTLTGANTYVGDTTVSAGTLEITADDSLPSTTTLEITSGAGMVLNNPSEQLVTALTFDGEPAYKGTWGGPDSPAEHTKELFTGTGVLNVLVGPGPPGTIIMLR